MALGTTVVAIALAEMGFCQFRVWGGKIVSYFARVFFAPQRLPGSVSRAGVLAFGVGLSVCGVAAPTGAAVAAEKASAGPLVVNVSLNRQRLAVYDGTKRIATSPVSSGRRGHATPMGVFTVVQKRRRHISNIYNVSMPNMQRLTWSGIAMHAGVLPGYPASSGCIRLPHGFSRTFFGMTKMGTRVIVSRDPVSPAEISHERLFNAYPSEDTLASRTSRKAPKQVADASLAAGGTETVSTDFDVAAARSADASALPPLSDARKRFVERRAAEAGEIRLALRTAGYAVVTTRDQLADAEREADAARAVLAKVGSHREAYLSEVEKNVAWARDEIVRLEAPEPAEDDAAARRSEKESLTEDARAARIAELRLEIEDAELEIAPLRARVEEMRAERAAAEARASAAEAALEAATLAVAEAKAALEAATDAENAAKKRAAKRDLPVSIFVSRERQRLYVRQGFDDMFDVEVTFKDPEAPIGTHVFTALDWAPEIRGMSWSVVSVPYDPTRRLSRKKKAEAGPVDLEAQTAEAALERFEIPEDAREAIADVMKPGSSMVISDFRLSLETGKYTDFIGTIR